MKRILFITLLAFLPLFLMAEPIKIKTVQSYVETPTLGKTYKEETVVFEVDTIERTLVVKTVMNTLNYTMSEFYPTVNNDKFTIIKFEVKAGGTMTKKYVVRIPKPLAGNKISVRETMATATREMPSTTYLTDDYEDGSHFDTKYISKYFHDTKDTSPTLDHRCGISYSDNAVMIADFDGTSEMRMLQVYSVDRPSGTKGKVYHCKGSEGDFLFEVSEPQGEYSTPIFRLTRLVEGKPVVTTEYFGDFIE